MKLKYILLGVIALIVGYIAFDSLTQPSPSSLKGNFKEVALYRNENNTGPVQRIYAVSVADTLWEEMQQYGEMMPYTKFGTTTVYFFKEGGAVPTSLIPSGEPFGEEYQQNCIGKYQKGSMAEVSFSKQPF